MADIREHVKNLKLKKIGVVLKDPRIGLKVCTRKVIGTLFIATPFALAGGLGLLSHKVPFYRDYKELEAHTRIECSSDGEFGTATQYEKFAENEENELVMYGEWQLGEDGTYTRTVENYDTKNLTYQYAELLFDLDESLISDILGKSNDTRRQIASDTPEDLDRGSYYEATIYSIDENNTITIQQSKNEDVSDVVDAFATCLLVTPLTGIAYMCYQGTKFYDFLCFYGDEYHKLDNEISLLDLHRKIK